jgi:hypothetical protein
MPQDNFVPFSEQAQSSTQILAARRAASARHLVVARTELRQINAQLQAEYGADLQTALAEARTYTPRQIRQHRYDAQAQAEALRERGV